MSLSAYILKDAERLANQPTLDEWFVKARRLRPLKLKESTVETVRAIRQGR
jgi:hypothetical protein